MVPKELKFVLHFRKLDPKSQNKLIGITLRMAEAREAGVSLCHIPLNEGDK